MQKHFLFQLVRKSVCFLAFADDSVYFLSTYPQFLNMLIKLINAKNTMEIGVYTGYSLLPTVLALPQEGKVLLSVCFQLQSYELGLPIIEKACAAQTIDDFGEGPGLPVLDEVIVDVMPISSPPPTTVLLLFFFCVDKNMLIFFSLRK
ncbi:unnamed protein product [Coffea canephora]|uniref:Caffeoyl-CoA O-methyltransferase n=1 Tax=Coffea canephora TaxID=49390 RepID=A0A068V6C2_COFCA|nr:unnamed protein product [Coffea canephora]